MTRVLVTGANGLLGQKLMALLFRQPGIVPIALARKPTQLPQGVTADITDKAALLAAISQAKPEVVVHTAAMTQVDQCELERDACWNTNVFGTANVVEACKAIGSHLVHVSTDFVFDGSHGPLKEDEPTGPVNYYGQSKLAAEELVTKSGLDWSIIRTVLVYGISTDMSRSNIVLWVKSSLEQKKPIKVVNDQWRTPTLAEDLATGCWLAVKDRATGVFHISGDEMMTPYDIAIRTAAYYQLDASLIEPVSSATFKQPAVRPMKTGFVIDKARKVLGYEPHSFNEGLAILNLK